MDLAHTQTTAPRHAKHTSRGLPNNSNQPNGGLTCSLQTTERAATNAHPQRIHTAEESPQHNTDETVLRTMQNTLWPLATSGNVLPPERGYEMSWLVKVRRNGGGESVVSRHESHWQAEMEAAGTNDAYQSDNYYVEEYDTAKSEWPTAIRAQAFLATRRQINEDEKGKS